MARRRTGGKETMETLLRAALEKMGDVDFFVKFGEKDMTAFVNALIKVLPLRDEERAPLEIRDAAARAAGDTRCRRPRRACREAGSNR